MFDSLAPDRNLRDVELIGTPNDAVAQMPVTRIGQLLGCRVIGNGMPATKLTLGGFPAMRLPDVRARAIELGIQLHN